MSTVYFYLYGTGRHKSSNQYRPLLELPLCHITTVFYTNKIAAQGEENDEIFNQRFSDEEAEEDDSDINRRKEEARREGLVPFDDWEEKFRSVMKDHNKSEFFPDAFKAVMKASKATCLVKRVNGSKGRKEYLEGLAKKYTGKEKTYHENRAKNWDTGGSGTGLLVQPKFLGKGWLVITNNHVIMNECEAKTAEVYFDYNHDAPKGKKLKDVEECKMFKVQELVSTSLRTENSGDKRTLDYSLLLLNDDGEFLADRAMSFDESPRVQAANNKVIVDLSGGPRPLVMFSHPYGLAKRLSIGSHPVINGYPVSHIRHDLGSLPGSSGGNLLFSPVDDKCFRFWRAAFVHYRGRAAVSWQAIGPHLRETLGKKNDADISE